MYSEKLLRQLAEKTEPLRPFPIPGWVHNGHWIARSDAKADGRPVDTLNEASAREWLAEHLDAEQEPLEHVGFALGESGEHLRRLYEGPYGVVAIDEDYAILLEGLIPVQLCTDTRDRAPIGGVDDEGILQCWIMPTRV